MAKHTRTWLVTGVLLFASTVLDSGFRAQPSQPPAVPSAARRHSGHRPSRVVATITALEGSVHVPGVEVELQAEDGMTIAKTLSDTTGQVTFPDVPPGRYRLRATRLGFGASDSAVFNVRRGETTQVLVDISLTFVAPGVEVVGASPRPAAAKTPEPVLPSQTVGIQPVSASDMMSGNVLDLAPLPGDDFQSLLPMLPGVVRGPDGRLRIKGGQPTQGALQVSSASLVDPSTGDFDLQLPGQSIESVEVLANPFAAEYGRFSTSVTQIRTVRGTNDWKIKPGNLVPRFRGDFSGLRAFEPRFSIRGPLKPRSPVPVAGPAVPLRDDAGAEPAGRTRDQAEKLRFVHAPGRRHLEPPHARRRADHVPARGRKPRHEHVPAGGDDSRPQSERRRHRPARPLRAGHRRRARNDAGDPQLRGQRQQRRRRRSGEAICR